MGVNDVCAINLHQWLAVSKCYNTMIEVLKNAMENSYTLNLLTLMVNGEHFYLNTRSWNLCNHCFQLRVTNGHKPVGPVPCNLPKKAGQDGKLGPPNSKSPPNSHRLNCGF
ncbi:uncharacterized protein DS421_20g698840 [Arachis hypogaea]|nr:uncharacterized protein DS421_20g698840 [Arachis hypogaea]